MERLGSCVVLGLEAGQDGPGDGEDPEQGDEPCQRSETDDHDPAFADPELRAAPFAVRHARSSSLKRLESTRSANVAITIAKMTTTIAYADAAPYRKPPPIDSW